VSWNKGCYLGQEVVCMQDMRGKLKRRLVALELGVAGAEPLPAIGTPVTADGQTDAVGELTSVTRDPSTGLGLAIARLKSPFFDGAVAVGVAGKPARFVAQSSPEIG
jgi:folate-binding Fe-S cluster repair protein YgfZ